MRTSSLRKGGNRSWRRVDMQADRMPAVADLMREAGPLLGQGVPITAHILYDGQHRPRGVHATCADGWRATLVIYADGTAALSQALKVVTELKLAL